MLERIFDIYQYEFKNKWRFNACKLFVVLSRDVVLLKNDLNMQVTKTTMVIIFKYRGCNLNILVLFVMF